MGTKTVEIDENSDIIVDGVKYDGTTGLWALVMMNDPPVSRYTPNDLHMYEDLVYRTNVMNLPHNVVLGKSRYKKTFSFAAEDDNTNHHAGGDNDDDAAFQD